MFPQLTQFSDYAILLLRLMVALVFVDSGWTHVTKADERSKDMGLSKGVTIVLGVAEIAGGLGVAFGVLTQLAAIGLILVMLGAIQRKIRVWKISFWGGKSYGWHYELMFVLMNIVIITTNGGRFVIWK